MKKDTEQAAPRHFSGKVEYFWRENIPSFSLSLYPVTPLPLLTKQTIQAKQAGMA